MTDKCIECKFWLHRRTTNVGECRRYAPRKGGAGVFDWPVTRREDWCGEFQPRDDADGGGL